MKKQGTEHELFVQKIMQAIVDAEPIAQQKNITINWSLILKYSHQGLRELLLENIRLLKESEVSQGQ